MSDIDVSVYSEGDTNYLKVILPSRPDRMPIDRRMIRSPIMSDDSMRVEDSNGEEVDVDAVMNESLNLMLSKYEATATKNAVDLTKQYFTNLAYSSNLSLVWDYHE